MHHLVITSCLLLVCVLLCMLCAVGLLAARDPFQRLQFCTPIASVAVPLLAAAVWLADPDWQSRIKIALIAFILFIANSVLSHATSRSIRIREQGHWAPTPEEHIPMADNQERLSQDAPEEKE